MQIHTAYFEACMPEHATEMPGKRIHFLTFLHAVAKSLDIKQKNVGNETKMGFFSVDWGPNDVE
jgi:hypothetical protein